MIENFAVIEADFQREYGIDLGREVWWMPWRRFLVLLRGLTPRSGWYSLARTHATGPRKIAGRQVDDYFASIA